MAHMACPEKHQEQFRKYVDAVQANFDNSKKKKPQAVDNTGLKTINKKPIQVLKKLSMPSVDAKNEKLMGIAWAPPSGNPDSPLENRLAFARQDHLVAVFDVAKNYAKYACKSPWCQCIALHPTKDGMILTGGMSNATTLWKPKGESDPGRLMEVTVMKEHDGYISSLKFVGTGGDKYLSASGDADIRLFDVEKKVSIMRLCGHEKDAQYISFPMDNLIAGDFNTFATCSSDKTVKLWDLRSGVCTHAFREDCEFNACSMFPNGNYVAAGGEKDKTYLFDVRACYMVSKYARNNKKTASIAWSKSGRHLYVGHDDGALIMWDIFASGENKMYASKIEAHTKFDGGGTPITSNSRVQAMDINHDGVLASCGFDGNVVLWKAPAE